MFRIRFAGGQISDMANFDRIKDAALVIALGELNSEAEERALRSPPVRQNARAVVRRGSGNGGAL
jgi:hypothetical protein